LSEDLPSYPAGFREGSLLAGYRLEAQVGAGGMAVVFRARDERLNRLAALKILAPALASDPEFRSRFIAESRAAAMVDDPHIIPVYEADEAAGVLFIAMRFVSGGDLRRVLRDEGPLRPERAMQLLSPVASALDAAHAAGLVHRDVKPANILVDARAGRPDHVYLSDFGIAKAVAASVSLTQTGFRLGTPDYSAPEHIEGRAVDGRADQYALACVAYQLLTGVVPFERDQAMQVMFAHVSAPVPSLAARRPDLPASAGEVLAHGMAKLADERYESCGDFADALRGALGLAPYHPDKPAATAVPSGVALPSGAPSAVALPAVALPAVPPVPAPPTEALAKTAEPQTVTRVLEPAAGRPGRRAARRWPVVFSAGAVIVIAAVTTVYLTFSGKPATKTRAVASGGRQVGVLASPGGYQLYYAAFSRDGTSIASFGGQDGHKFLTHIYLWAAGSRQLAATLTDTNDAGYGGWPGGIAFSADSKTLIAGDYDGFVHLWDVASRRATLVRDPDYTDAFTPSILASGYSPAGGFIAEGNNLGNIHLLRLSDRQWTATFKDPTAAAPGRINQVIASPSGKTLAASDTTGRVYVWDTSGKSLILTTRGIAVPRNPASDDMALSPGAPVLAIAMAGKKGTQLRDLSTGQVSATLQGPGTAPEAVAFSPDGETLAVGDAGGVIYLWDVPARRIAATINCPISGDNWGGLVFSPDGKTLAAFGNGGTEVLLYKVAYTGSALPPFAACCTRPATMAG
jgi:serine/threonine-protein kinase